MYAYKCPTRGVRWDHLQWIEKSFVYTSCGFLDVRAEQMVMYRFG